MPIASTPHPADYSSRCHHVGIFVYDTDRMARFYIKRLGFKFDREYTSDKKIMKRIFGISSFCAVQYLLLGDFRLELFRFTGVKLKKRHARTSGLNHWTLLVHDKIGFCEGLKKNKVKVIKIVKPDGGFTIFIKDPEENIIEIKDYQDKNYVPKRY